MESMTPSRPYFVRAIFDWVVDNECTPYLSVFAGFPGVDVPLEFVEDEHITLNISPSAVVDFHFDNEAISFKARFSGVSRSLFIPMGAIVGLFAKENGQGMGFPDELFYQEQAEALSAAIDAKAQSEVVVSEPSALKMAKPSDNDQQSVPVKAKTTDGDTDKAKEPTPVKTTKKASKVSHLKIIK
jgi:stringent starvation protein B